MRKLTFFITITFLCLLTQAQNIDMNIRDRFQRITVVDNSGVTRGATVFIPSDWSASDTNSYWNLSFTGNGTTGALADSIKDAPGHLRSTSYWYPNSEHARKWDFKIIRNNGQIAKIAFVQIGYGGSSTNDAQYLDANQALWAKFLKQTGYDSTIHQDKRLHSTNLSGGPDRFIDAFLNTTDTANPFIRKVKRVVFMSPTGTASSGLINPQLRVGKYLVWFASNDNNSGTTPAMAYSLYNKLSIVNEKYIDSLVILNSTLTAPQAGHNWKIWDSCLSIAGTNYPAGTGGDATTNTWRWLIDDYAVAGNQIPIAEAGNDQTILPGATVTLNGDQSRDVDGTITAYQWSAISGPSGVTFSNANVVSPTVTGLNSSGTYVFQLRVTDNVGAFSTDQMSVVVQSNQVPIVNAGADKDILLPTDSVRVIGSATDNDGTILSYSWTKVSGGAATIKTPSAATTDIVGLAAGYYQFRLTATDNQGGTSSDIVQVFVTEPVDPQTVIKVIGRNPVIKN